MGKDLVRRRSRIVLGLAVFGWASGIAGAQETKVASTGGEPSVPGTQQSITSTEVPAPGTVPEVVVTANRIETPYSQVGSSVTVISGEEISRRQQPLVADVLRTTPGLDVARSGGNNQITSVFMRGAESSHTLVLIDGVEANDPTSPNRAFDFSTLTAENVEKIEVLRGPQSTLWGSNAMGGVINVITKKGEGKPSGYVYAEGGSYHTFREGLGFSGSKGPINYSLALTQQNSEGFSAASERFGATEEDGYSSTNFSTRLGWDISEQLEVAFIARYNHSETDIDDFGGPGGDDPDRKLRSDQGFFRIQPRLSLLDGKWINTFGASYTWYQREDTDESFPDDIEGGIYRFDWQSDYHLAKNHTLTFGLSVDEETLGSQSFGRHYADSVGIFVQDSISFGEKLFLTGGLRYEDHSISESAWTGRATAAYFVLPQTKVHASYGTGFKTPSLSNLFSSFGDPDLEPEKVRGWDAGVTQTFYDERLSLDATFFRNDFQDLIDFDFVASKLQNIGSATTQGLEVTLAARPLDNLALSLNYTYTDTLNNETDQSLLRRTPHKVGGSVSWQYLPKGNITASLVYSGSRADIDPVSFGRTRIGTYTLLNVATSYQLTENLSIFGRVENVLDADYEEVAGFGTAEVSVYGGLKLSF